MNDSNTRSTLLVLFLEVAKHAFVIATGVAALVHSTWTLATIFNGPEPAIRDLHWITWVAAAFLFAFSIDVGQIAISVELRAGERTRWKFIAFATLAGLTYFFQWWYVAMHLPDMPLAAGVRAEWRGVATFIRDAALWVVPGALPLATTIYTFSYAKPKIVRTAKGASAQTQKAIVSVPQPASDITIELPEKVIAICDVCGQEVGTYTNNRSASAAISAHKRHHHSPEQIISNNGRHE